MIREVKEVKEVREIKEREIKEISEIKEREAQSTCRVGAFRYKYRSGQSGLLPKSRA